MSALTSTRPEGARAPIWRPGDDVQPLRALLTRGGILGIPTESSYGLAADPMNPTGVQAIFRLKGRSADKPLPVVMGGVGVLAGLGIDPADSGVAWLADRWPAPLSGILRTSLPVPAASGTGALAVRVPAFEPLRELLDHLDCPLTATSANAAGEPPILGANELARWLAGEDAVVVDGGMLRGGPPSTMVRFEPASGRHRQVHVVREGAFRAELATELQS